MHPDCQQKVFDELRTIFPDQNSDVTSTDLSQLKYTNYVIMETMRLNTPVPFMTRTIKHDMQVGKFPLMTINQYLVIINVCLFVQYTQTTFFSRPVST